MGAILSRVAVFWVRSIPILEEIRSVANVAFVSDYEVPVILTSSRNLRALEREGARLDISGSDPSHLALAKTLERCASLDRRRRCTFAIANACERQKRCDPTSLEIERAEALLIDLERVSWKFERRTKATIVGRFVQRGALKRVHSPYGRFFGTTVERRRGDVVRRKRSDRRGVVLFVEWREARDVAVADIFGITIMVAHKTRSPVYVVLSEDGRFERWSDASVFGAARPPLVLDGDVVLEPNPTKLTRPNLDRDHYHLSDDSWSRLLRDACRRDTCFFVRAKHKRLLRDASCTLALYVPATLWIGASAKAPTPPGDLVKRRFASHGCCPKAAVRLYALRLDSGVRHLPAHRADGLGSESHTYLMLLQLHDDLEPPFVPRTPRAAHFLDSSFDSLKDLVHPPYHARTRSLRRTRRVFRPRPTNVVTTDGTSPFSRARILRNATPPLDEFLFN